MDAGVDDGHGDRGASIDRPGDRPCRLGATVDEAPLGGKSNVIWLIQEPLAYRRPARDSWRCGCGPGGVVLADSGDQLDPLNV